MGSGRRGEKEWHVPLPSGIRPPFEVYVNGIRQELGTNYRISSGELVFTRVFNAPRELMFEVWTDPMHLEKWWGPNGFTTRVQPRR